MGASSRRWGLILSPTRTTFRALTCALMLGTLVVTGIAAGSPARWQQLTLLPKVTITSEPAGTTTAHTASFTFTAVGRTTCRLDGGLPSSCSSPMNYSAIADGTHVFRVEARSNGRTASASATWTATTPAPTPAPAPTAASVAAPAPPSSYAIPAGARTVTNSTELIAALQGSNQDIVLADGTYDNATAFNNANSNRLYAAHLGGAIFKAGLILGGNFGAGGGLVQGVAFDVSSPEKVLGGGIIHVWGPGGARSQVLDCTFRGNKVISAGIKAYQPSGFVARRLQFFDFTDFGMLVTDNATVAYGSATPRADAISDISVEGVARAARGSSNGTAEQGILIGNPVANGIRRIKIRNAAWDGIETANNAWDTTFSDLDIDMSGSYYGVGIYLEHYSYYNTFTNFFIRGAKLGINMEWNDPVWSSRAAAHFTTIKNGTIDAAGNTLPGNQAGVYLQPGTEATTVQGVIFKNQNWAAIGADSTTGTNSFSANDFTGLKTGAVGLRTTPLNG